MTDLQALAKALLDARPERQRIVRRLPTECQQELNDALGDCKSAYMRRIAPECALSQRSLERKKFFSEPLPEVEWQRKTDEDGTS